ncbi:MAG: anthranilate phosphoribosyltransferase family protein [Cyanobacteriota bacterium]|nr:anthranilate phosphoribosyltransferase family protein [Cyanobacteriota bacterium]
MSERFREWVKKVGSGQHTSQDLNREEAAQAMRMMLTGEATPAQIGAFLIAHRIKRPTPSELAGMLDAYSELGPLLPPLPLARPLLIFGHPYDGRSRTAPLAALVALLLAVAGSPVLLHGSGRCPTKYGIPLLDLWLGLGVDWRGLELAEMGQILQATGLGFLYLPDHFPAAQMLMSYRDQIGKRPPLATLELIWTPYAGSFRLISGFVHPPTEETMHTTLSLRGVESWITVKGLEGSCDLPQDRTVILSLGQERLLLRPRDYGMAAASPPLPDFPLLIEQMQQTLEGSLTPLSAAVVWNGGFYLWQAGHAADLRAGMALAQAILAAGDALAKLEQLQAIRQQVGSQVCTSR